MPEARLARTQEAYGPKPYVSRRPHQWMDRDTYGWWHCLCGAADPIPHGRSECWLYGQVRIIEPTGERTTP